MSKLAREIRASETALYRTLIENIPHIVWFGEPDGKVTFLNNAWYEMTGRKPQESLGMRWVEVLHPEDRPQMLRKWPHRYRIGHPFEGEYRFRTKNGTYRIHHFMGTPVKDAAGLALHWVGISTDVTERRRLEERLRGKQRMEAVGRLAGGIAHDFNNLLAVIENYSQFVLEEIPDDSPIYKDVEEIKRATKKASALTKQLLAFGRQQILRPEPIDLNEVVRDLKKMLRRLIQADIRVITNLREDIGTIKADRTQIEQVIMNLVVNARDAMPSGGELTFETSNIDVDIKFAQAHPGLKIGSYVVLTISDTGHGMDEETKGRVFEPFFTTKSINKGTGLGLSTVYGVVKQSDGYIAIDSQMGAGTSFKIYLPRQQQRTSVSQEIKKSAKLECSAAGDETILVVEDDDTLRKAIERALKKHGYNIIVASNGKDALIKCKENEGKIHLLLSDVVMPEMGGGELVRFMKNLKQEIPVVYISGYADDTIAHRGVLDRDAAFLPKPFSPDKLVAKIREVLDSGH